MPWVPVFHGGPALAPSMAEPVLSSNGIALPNTSRYVGVLRESTLQDVDDGTASHHLVRDGYVLIKGALPRDEVLTVRESYLSLFPPELFRDGDLRCGAYSGRMPDDLPPHGINGHPAHQFVRSRVFLEFADRPVLRRIAEALLNGPVERVQRTPLRHFIHSRPTASRAHTDGDYIVGDAHEVVTLWLPIGDCPIEAGALVYLEDSHHEASLAPIRRGAAPTDRPQDRRPITHDLKWLADVTGKRWLMTNFEAGDVIAHTAGIVHASLDPASDMMRISTDIRFIRSGSTCDPRWAQDWSADDGY